MLFHRFRQDLPEESKKRIIERTIKECEQCRDYPEEAYLTNLWKSTLSALGLSDPVSGGHTYVAPHHADAHALDEGQNLEIELPTQRTISDWVEELTGVPIVEQVNNQMIKWSAAFVDEGLAGWEMPSRQSGFYQAWRELAQRDHSGRLLCIERFCQKVCALPHEPEDAIVSLLRQLGIPEQRWREYLSRQLSQLPGWTGLIRWLGENPAYHAQRKHPIDPIQYLAVRLFYEVELVQVECQEGAPNWPSETIRGAFLALNVLAKKFATSPMNLKMLSCLFCTI